MMLEYNCTYCGLRINRDEFHPNLAHSRQHGQNFSRNERTKRDLDRGNVQEQNLVQRRGRNNPGRDNPERDNPQQVNPPQPPDLDEAIHPLFRGLNNLEGYEEQEDDEEDEDGF